MRPNRPLAPLPSPAGDRPDDVAARIESQLTQITSLSDSVRADFALLVRAAATVSQAAPAPRLLTTAQAAEVLALGRSTVEQLVRDGRLGSVKIGAARRVPVEAVDDYVRSLTSKSA